MKFKIGDAVKAINNSDTTNKDFKWEGIVVEVNENDFSARTIKNGRVDILDSIYRNLNYDDFELINSNPVDDVDMLINELINNNINLFSRVDFKYEIKAKGPILNEKEKEYLKAVIKPFRDRIVYIMKGELGQEYILVCLGKDGGTMSLPGFTPGTMYKGMKMGRHYILEELGL